MSMTPSADEQRARALLADSVEWRDRPEVREAAHVRSRLDLTRATRAANILAYLTADRAGWPAHVDAMLREELGIDDIGAIPKPDDTSGPYREEPGTSTQPPLAAEHPGNSLPWIEPHGGPISIDPADYVTDQSLKE